jgi:hypothetical protein
LGVLAGPALTRYLQSFYAVMTVTADLVAGSAGRSSRRDNDIGARGPSLTISAAICRCRARAGEHDPMAARQTASSTPSTTGSRRRHVYAVNADSDQEILSLS